MSTNTVEEQNKSTHLLLEKINYDQVGSNNFAASNPFDGFYINNDGLVFFICFFDVFQFLSLCFAVLSDHHINGTITTRCTSS